MASKSFNKKAKIDYSYVEAKTKYQEVYLLARKSMITGILMTIFSVIGIIGSTFFLVAIFFKLFGYLPLAVSIIIGITGGSALLASIVFVAIGRNHRMKAKNYKAILEVLQNTYEDINLSETLTEKEIEYLNNKVEKEKPHIVPNTEPVPEVDMSKKRKVLNVFWIIFVGIWGAALNAISGVLLCATIFGISSGIATIKYVPLIFSPIGKEVKLYYKRKTFKNTINVLFGGVQQYIAGMIIGAIFCMTIVGIPLGLQMFKITKYHLAPYGAEITAYNGYSKKKDHYSDYHLMLSQMRNDPKKVKLSNGKQVSIEEALKTILTKEEKDILLEGTTFNRTTVEGIGKGLWTTIFSLGIVTVTTLLVTFILGRIFPERSFMDFFETMFKFSTQASALVLVAQLIVIPFVDAPLNKKKKEVIKLFQDKLVAITTYYPASNSTEEKLTNLSYFKTRKLIQDEVCDVAKLY